MFKNALKVNFSFLSVTWQNWIRSPPKIFVKKNFQKYDKNVSNSREMYKIINILLLKINAFYINLKKLFSLIFEQLIVSY